MIKANLVGFLIITQKHGKQATYGVVSMGYFLEISWQLLGSFLGNHFRCLYIHTSNRMAQALSSFRIFPQLLYRHPLPIFSPFHPLLLSDFQFSNFERVLSAKSRRDAIEVEQQQGTNPIGVKEAMLKLGILRFTYHYIFFFFFFLPLSCIFWCL